jgi:hypothetical protein
MGIVVRPMAAHLVGARAMADVRFDLWHLFVSDQQ